MRSGFAKPGMKDVFEVFYIISIYIDMSITSPFRVLQTRNHILHVDGDAFFASVYQATHAEARGKPVVIGRERGIATALSYEAKKRGVRRGMLVSQARKLCPEAIIVTSDYRMYQIFSNKIVDMASSYSPHVEHYSIDEVFVDITNFHKVHGITYSEIGRRLKRDIESSLGITVSVGVAPTKTLAKIASSFKKPSGFVHITQHNAEAYLRQTEVHDIWGVGHRLAIRLKRLGIHTAWDFVNTSEAVISKHFNKLVVETWYELRGKAMFNLSTESKTEYQSIRKSHTVTPPTRDPHLLLSRLLYHIEKAFVKARRYNYHVGQVHIFLKTQRFTFHGAEITLKEQVEYPYLIRKQIRSAFNRIYKPDVEYRATGCTLTKLQKNSITQPTLFEKNEAIHAKLKNVYPLVDARRIGFASDLYESNRRARSSLLKTPLLEPGR